MSGKNFQHWLDDIVNTQTPGGESLVQMQRRVNAFIEELICQDHQHVAIVTHAGVQRLFLAWVLEIPLQNMFQYSIDFSAVFEMKTNGARFNSSIKLL